MTIELRELPDLSPITGLKKHYLESLVAPLDGMWGAGFTDPAPHWEIRSAGERVGYCAVNHEGTLLQFFVCAEATGQARELFDHVIAQPSVKKAVASTIDPAFLSLCLDRHVKLEVHTYLYELDDAASTDAARQAEPALRPVEDAELERTVEFQRGCLGGGDELIDWLRGYSSNLIGREELFVRCRDEDWIGLGEFRRSDSQPGVVDVGMMVDPSHRGRGQATEILQRLVALSRTEGLRAICSTTVDNRAAQRAIVRAGFVSRHRILNVLF